MWENFIEILSSVEVTRAHWKFVHPGVEIILGESSPWQQSWQFHTWSPVWDAFVNFAWRLLVAVLCERLIRDFMLGYLESVVLLCIVYPSCQSQSVSVSFTRKYATRYMQNVAAHVNSFYSTVTVQHYIQSVMNRPTCSYSCFVSRAAVTHITATMTTNLPCVFMVWCHTSRVWRHTVLGDAL